MRTANLLDAYPTFFDLNGKPLMGRISVFENETRAFADTWLDPDGKTRASNPMKTNGAGKTESQVFVEMPSSGQRIYTVVVEEFLGEQYSSMDEYWEDGEMWKGLYDFKLVVDAGSGVKSVTVGSVSEIAGMDSGNGIVVAAGFYNAGDCPARVFVYTPKAVFPEDGCTSIKSKDGGYWTWVPNPTVDSGCFGIIPSASTSNINAGFLSLQMHTNSSDRIKKVCFRSGTYFLSVNVDIDCDVLFKRNARLNPTENISLSFRSVSAKSGFIARSLFNKNASLSVKEGAFYFSWFSEYADNSEIGNIGTPETIVVDKKLKLTQTVINSAQIIGSGPKLKFKDSFVFSYCRFSGSTILDTSQHTSFVNCGKIRTSKACDTFYASTIAESTVGTTFIVDSEVVMDVDLSQENTGFTTEDGAYFNGMAEPGTLTIDAKSLGMWMLSCEACIKNTHEIRLDWFRQGITTASRLSNSCSASSIFAVDLCGLELNAEASLYEMSYRNGFLVGSFTKKLSLDGISGTVSITGATLVVKDSKVTFTKMDTTGLQAYNSICSGDSMQVDGIVIVSGSELRFVTNVINGTKTQFLDSSVSGKGSIESTRFECYGTDMGLIEVIADVASVSLSKMKSLSTDERLVSSSVIKEDNVIFDNQKENVIRKDIQFSDGFMGRTEETYPLLDVNAQARLNAGVYNMASKGRTKLDVFGIIPSFPIFITQDDCVSLLDTVGSSRSYSTVIGSFSGTAYGIIGKSRPKPGQILVIMSCGAESKTKCLIGRAKRAAGFDGTTDIVNEYGGLQNTSLQPFTDSVAHKRLIVNDGPIILYCLGPGYVGSDSVPVFWNVNGDTLELQ